MVVTVLLSSRIALVSKPEGFQRQKSELSKQINHPTTQVTGIEFTTSTMGVPFEALLPYGIMLAMFGVTGAGLSKIRHMQNGGKRGRHSVDQWDRVMMDRDRRLTGFLRGQTDNPAAPAGFELNNPWRCGKNDHKASYAQKIIRDTSIVCRVQVPTYPDFASDSRALRKAL
ncbi:hypothetical protein DL98DRAFT_508142 [Cadophora sp. DSE1049]|nr:hypothetical protein DL98DRAFT_508142 [Cadophora sp. DSE1049]